MTNVSNYAADEHCGMGRKNALCTNDEHFSAGDKCVECMFKLPPHTVTHVATSNFQAELHSKLLLTGTHLRKWAVAMLSYSPASTLHPRVISALVVNSLQVRQVDKENDKT